MANKVEVNANDKRVADEFSAKPETGSSILKEFRVTWNFQDVSMVELLTLATRAARIDYQRRWRSAYEKGDHGQSWYSGVKSVRHQLDLAKEGRKAVQEPLPRAISAAAKLSKEERATLRAELEALDAAEAD